MVAITVGLVGLAFVAIYSALVLGKKTDQRITRYLTEDDENSPMLGRFSDDVLRGKSSLTHG